MVSHGTYIGLNALPLVRGEIDDSFITASLTGIVDGEGFTQDAMTVVSGKLPPLASATGIVLSPQIAALFGVGVGGRVTYVFLSGSQQHPATDYRSFRRNHDPRNHRRRPGSAGSDRLIPPPR